MQASECRAAKVHPKELRQPPAVFLAGRGEGIGVWKTLGSNKVKRIKGNRPQTAKEAVILAGRESKGRSTAEVNTRCTMDTVHHVVKTRWRSPTIPGLGYSF